MWLSACTSSAWHVVLVAADGWVAGLINVGSPTAFNVAVGGWAAGAVSVGSPTAFNVAVCGWAVGAVSVGSPIAFNVAVGGWAADTVSVGSPTAFNVAMGGWAVGTIAAKISTSHCCLGSKTLALIEANQGEDGGCTCLHWVHWPSRRGFGR